KKRPLIFLNREASDARIPTVPVCQLATSLTEPQDPNGRSRSAPPFFGSYPAIGVWRRTRRSSRGVSTIDDFRVKLGKGASAVDSLVNVVSRGRRRRDFVDVIEARLDVSPLNLVISE